MKLANWLSASAASVPERVALIDAEGSLTYAELERRAGSAARRLARLGVGRGDHVALTLGHSGEYVVLLHALMKLGAVAAPLDPGIPQRELDARLERLGPTVVIRDGAQIAEVKEADVPLEATVSSESVHCIIHTSGTGGRAKPVELTYANHLWSALGSAVRIGVDPNDRWLCCLPLHHIGGLAIALRSAIYATGAVVERFDADRIRELIPRERLTLASLVGTTLGRLLDASAELDRLRCVLVGGGPVQSALVAGALEAGVPIAPTYGLTEAASQVTTLPPGEARRKPASAGTPILPAEVRIEDGLILVRGPNVARSELGADGWLRTHDLGRIDEDGHLYVLGREDEVILTGGEKVSPLAVEWVLQEHPAVADAAVGGKDDREWGQAVLATVVLQDGVSVTVEELRDHCRTRLARHEVPKEIRFASRLPRDEQGKLRRAAL